ncbi:MAG: hypothetical protein JNK02_17155 [Planctomycetes bacterium]|nr:hypothetical protein [Planctomycetota bacterium]
MSAGWTDVHAYCFLSTHFHLLTAVDSPICDATEVSAPARAPEVGLADWTVELPRIRFLGWRLVEVALMCELCALTWAGIGRQIGTAEPGAIRAHRLPCRALAEIADYGPIVSCVAAQAISRRQGARRAVGVAALR